MNLKLETPWTEIKNTTSFLPSADHDQTRRLWYATHPSLLFALLLFHFWCFIAKDHNPMLGFPFSFVLFIFSALLQKTMVSCWVFPFGAFFCFGRTLWMRSRKGWGAKQEAKVGAKQGPSLRKTLMNCGYFLVGLFTTITALTWFDLSKKAMREGYLSLVGRMMWTMPM